MIKILVGNKCDLEEERVVTKKEAEEFARTLGLKYIETSAKERINIDETFLLLSEQIYESLPEGDKKSMKDQPINIVSNRRKKKGCC